MVKLEFDKIYHTDCLMLMRDMPDKCVDHVITSPPYNMKLRILKGTLNVLNMKLV